MRDRVTHPHNYGPGMSNELEDAQPLAAGAPLTEGTISANGIRFGYLEIGDGPLALLLHGFPDSAWTWRHLMPALADAGFRAVAPFLRGYAPSEVPADGYFQPGAIASDANALHEVLGGDERAVLIGHDWGALASYSAAAHQPQRWSRLVACAVPPPASLANAFFSYDQLQRSWYMFFFQSPFAEMVVPLNDLEFIDRLWSDWSPGFDASSELEHVKAALRDPANLTAAIAYYRATIGTGPRHAVYDLVEAAGSTAPPQPTLYLHGRTDGCMGVDLAADGARDSLTAEGSRVEIVDGAGHFLHLERPDLVNELIVDFLTT